MEKAVINRMEKKPNNRGFPDFKIDSIRKDEQDRIIAILVSEFGFTFSDIRTLKKYLSYFERG